MTTSLRSAVAVFGALLITLGPARAQDAKAPPATNAMDKVEAAYTKSIEGRAKDILTALALDDAAKSARVHDTLIAQYRALRAWHDANDDKRKELGKETGGTDKDAASGAQVKLNEINDSLRALHEQFLAKLSADLTPAQVETVKDKMTYNKVKVTYDSYCEIVPGLKDEEKAKLLEWLKKAREEAMDCGSSDEKSAVFKKYKGRINNYLSQQGHDVAKAYKDWGEKQRVKAKDAAPPPAE